MAQQSIEALKASVAERINDNEQQEISAADVRGSILDTIDTLYGGITSLEARVAELERRIING